MTYRNADTRLREAFDTLSQTIVNVFGSEMDQSMWEVINVLDRLESEVLDYAKQPASEG